MIHRLLAFLFGLARWQKRAILIGLDIGLMAASFFLAMMLRLDSLAFVADTRVWYALLVLVPVSLLVFSRLGFYRILIRFIGLRALPTIFFGVAASAAVLQLAIFYFGLPVPRSVPAIYVTLALVLMGGMRFCVRALFLSRIAHSKTRVIIYGAGESGRQLLSSLREGPEYAPVCFVDDSRALQGSVIGALPVFSPERLPDLIDRHDARTVLLAMPSIGPGRRAEILNRLAALPLRVQTIPGMADLVSGKARISEIADVAVEDLLGRDPVPPRQDLLDANIRGRTVLVTGAGGSIGAELCRQILRLGPKRLLLLELSEFALYSIDEDLRLAARHEALEVAIVPLTGSVRDRARMEEILARFAVDTVYHAAAYKHVPLVEQNVVEGIRNNVFGTLAMAEAAIAAGVSAFILISTDKAVRPANVMGASKRMAELICQALEQFQQKWEPVLRPELREDKRMEYSHDVSLGGHTLSGRQRATRFSMVRFGNVLGSSGSVIPLFRRQIAAGGPVTVTHPDITRYFMTIPEAAQLVIQAGAMAEGGDVFVLDMGEPVRIADLAVRMVSLSGLNPVVIADPAVRRPELRKGDIEIVFTGLRPGEKLYEELLIGAGAAATDHPRVMTAVEQSLPWSELEPLLARLEAACDHGDLDTIRQVLTEAPTGYAPGRAQWADLLANAPPSRMVPAFDLALLASPA